MAKKTPAPRDPYATDRTVPFTNRELGVMCNVTPMTLWIWRNGAPMKRGKLPTVKGTGRSVRYPVKGTMAFLRVNEVPILVHPDDLANDPTPSQLHALTPAAPRKPGPKPKATAANERPSAH